MYIVGWCVSKCRNDQNYISDTSS